MRILKHSKQAVFLRDAALEEILKREKQGKEKKEEKEEKQGKEEKEGKEGKQKEENNFLKVKTT